MRGSGRGAASFNVRGKALVSGAAFMSKPHHGLARMYGFPMVGKRMSIRCTSIYDEAVSGGEV